jgi:hypothetical protein
MHHKCLRLSYTYIRSNIHYYVPYVGEISCHHVAAFAEHRFGTKANVHSIKMAVYQDITPRIFHVKIIVTLKRTITILILITELLL